ncbi:hypothetical protein BDR26DRAFT_691500 [Obelidium mucronatum]|nr:hypothetical protein BDR26DRAFT_691500 [Obelidium mucronatum]
MSTTAASYPIAGSPKRAALSIHQADSALNLSEPDYFTSQPNELITRILGFLDASNLANVSECSSRLYCLATQDLLWKELCKHRWASKKHQEMSLHPFVDYTALIDRLDRAEKLAILRRRFFSSKLKEDMTEKEKDDELSQLVLHSKPVGWEGVTVFVPKKCSKWQASYVAAELDQNRDKLTMGELNAYDWLYHDNWSRGFYGGVYGNDADEETVVRVKFHPNGLRGNILGPESRPRMMPYHFTHLGAIQVGQYPCHSKPRRLPDWGWEFNNAYVTYSSMEPLGESKEQKKKEEN